jgi:hypothetical protein
MAVSSGFFNSIDGDRTYNADQMSTYFKGLISDGVYENVGSRLRITNGNGMSVNVGTGRAVVLSRWVENDAELNLTLDAADVQYNRIDAIAVRLDLTESGRTVSIVVKKGTNAANPEPPARSTGADVYELYLATVSVPKGTTAVTQDLITDLRPSDQCGWVTGLVEQVDTSDLYAQWAAAYAAYYAQSTATFDAYFAQKQQEFETWFEHLTEQLNVDTTLHQYQNTVTVSGTASTVTVGISDYDSAADLLSAYSNGILLVEGVDYTISGTGATAQIRLTNPLTGTNDITFVVIKSVIGEGGGALDLSANLMGYEAGVTDLSHGFVVLDSSGTIESGTYTIDGNEYSGLRLAGASTIATPDNMSVGTLKAKVIVTSFSTSSDQRIFSPKRGNNYNFRLTVWTSSSDNRLHYNIGGCEILDDSLVPVYPGYYTDYADPDITKDLILNKELIIEIRNDNTGYRTLYVNGVAKARKWTEGSSTVSNDGVWNSFTLGGNGTTGNDMLITEFKWIIE